MVGKKGYLRTVEAIIAIVVIMIIVYTAVPRNEQPPPRVPGAIASAQDYVSKEVSYNNTYRMCVVEQMPEGCERENCGSCGDWFISFFENNLPGNYNFTFKVCGTTNCVSSLLPEDRTIYMGDVFLASYEDQQNPRIFRFWMWRKAE